MLRHTVFRTEDVPVAERFDAWRQLLARIICPQEMSSEHEDDFRAETHLIELGAVRIWPSVLQPMQWRRTPAQVRQSDPELYHLSLPLTGTMGIRQAGQEAVHGAREMYIVDTSQAFDCSCTPVRGVGLEVPKRLVPLPPGQVAGLVTRRLPGRDGMGALLAAFLTGLAGQAVTLRPGDVPRLETVVVDLLSATLAHQLDAQDLLPPETRTRNLTRRIRAFVRQHLRDPELTPQAVARAHHISVSYLYQLFQNEGESVAALIREERLAGARRELSDPALAGVRVQDIAVRWGFTYHSSFTRAFQTRYGLSPRAYRHQTAAAPPVAPSAAEVKKPRKPR